MEFERNLRIAAGQLVVARWYSNMKMQTAEFASFWKAVQLRDKTLDGQFVYAVVSTGVFCRPGCPSRTPKPDNVRFFADPNAAAVAGFRPCLRCRPEQPVDQDIQAICKYIATHLDSPISLSTLGETFSLSPFYLQRKFKAALGISPRQYAHQLRLEQLKETVRNGGSITDAIYEAGFGSSSRVYEQTASHLGMTPKVYQKGGLAQRIRYSTAVTPLGHLLVAATDNGLCSIQFGDSTAALLAQLTEEFPAATIESGSAQLEPHIHQLTAWLAGKQTALDLPLDIRATAFQRLVWEYLQKIPYGATRSYSEVAADLGSPTATRAVARACATNPVALAIPCHRVVKQGGELAGYRWGINRKRSLLAHETRHATPSTKSTAQ